MARPRLSGGDSAASIEISRGVVNAFAAPCSTRPNRKSSIVGANTPTSEANPYATKATRTVRASPQRAARVPETSMRVANGTMYQVTAVAATFTVVSRPAPSSGSMTLVIAPPNGPMKPPA